MRPARPKIFETTKNRKEHERLGEDAAAGELGIANSPRLYPSPFLCLFPGKFLKSSAKCFFHWW